jgi:hypothetical protein
MTNDELILDCARSIRPYLARLVGDSADDVDRGLSVLLEQAQQGVDVQQDVLIVLQQHAATHNWTASFLISGHPPEVAGLIEKGIQDLAGRGRAVGAMRYICPRRDYVWYRRAVGQEIPICPTHHIALKPDTL